MKLLRIWAVIAFTGLATAVYAQNKTGQIEVFGNCEMCEKRIETTLKDAAISSAVWNKQSKFLTVTYDSTKISDELIQQKIVAVGHDTRKFKAKDEAYNKLPDCCKYERNGKTDKSH